MTAQRFALYYSAATISYVGDGVRFAALPLLAADLSTSPAQVALVAVAGGLPWLLFGLVAGVLVDRVDRLRLMALLQVVRVAITVSLAVGVLLKEVTVPALAALAFLLSSCEVVYDIAFNTALPAIVDGPRLQRANSRLITAEIVSFEFVGPALGGVLFALAPVLPFGFDSASFAISAVLLAAAARGTHRLGPAADRRSVRAELAAGLRWFFAHRVVRALTFVAVAVNLAAGGFYAMLVLLVRFELAVGAVGYGLVVAAGAVGGVLAGLVAENLTSGTQRRAVVLCIVPVTSACFLTVAIAGNVGTVVAAMIVFGWVVAAANVIMVSLRQLITPDAVLGRVMAVHRFFCWGALPVGALAAGVIGEAFGVRVAIAACGVIVVLAGVVTAFPLIRLTAADFAPSRG